MQKKVEKVKFSFSLVPYEYVGSLLQNLNSSKANHKDNASITFMN